MKYIFDVDGTLTPSRQPIDERFRGWFLEFVYDHEVYLVTGSDYAKTVEQLGKTICENVNRVYNCNGNDVWQEGNNIHTNHWILPETAHEWLSEQLGTSAFPFRTGLHFEHRPGMVNFSIVGRNADQEQRKKYRRWDLETEERDYISHRFNLLFPEIEARPGGETGIDISIKGNNKSQILKDFNKDDFMVFFGDRIDPTGNDWPLAQNILDNYKGRCYNVQSWQETWDILKEYD